MSDSGWIDHPKYGTVYQPDLSKAKADVHTEQHVRYGDEYVRYGEDDDILSELLNQVAFASARQTLQDLLDVGPGPVAGDMIRAVLATIDDQQHDTERNRIVNELATIDPSEQRCHG